MGEKIAVWINSASRPQRIKKEAKDALPQSAESRRVSVVIALAELEENPELALRPLLTELAADLRSSAPVEARGIRIELELDAPSTTQDVAVAAAFLITEIVEFAMLRHPGDTIEIALRREGELTATLAISSSVLVPDGEPTMRQAAVRANLRGAGPPASLAARPQLVVTRCLCRFSARLSDRPKNATNR